MPLSRVHLLNTLYGTLVRRCYANIATRWLILHINIDDVLVTREIVAAGKLLDVHVLDHLVIGEGRYVSMRERGLGFSK